MTRFLFIAILGLGSVAMAEGDHEGHGPDMHFQHHCSQCHGVDGISVLPYAPNLAGQKKDYLINQLRDFKAGVRPGTVMPQIAAQLTDQGIELMAEYISGMKTCQQP